MRAGARRHKITIQTKTITTDAFGGPVETWATFATVWAAVEPLQGRELEKAQAIRAEISTKISMRYLVGLDTSDRITHGGKYYNILALIDPELRHRELIIMASEGLNEG